MLRIARVPASHALYKVGKQISGMNVYII